MLLLLLLLVIVMIVLMLNRFLVAAAVVPIQLRAAGDADWNLIMMTMLMLAGNSDLIIGGGRGIGGGGDRGSSRCIGAGVGDGS